MSEATLLGGRYRLLDTLGRGGMGTVYAAVQEGLGRRVAVKLLDPRLAEDRVQLERFRREAEVVAALGHPNIVQVTDFQYPDDANPQPFLVMELLHGESLGGCLAREQVLAGGRAAFIAAQVLSALGAAHRAGVVHRDIKPDNIFLLADAAIPDTVKVLDFGIAKLASSPGSAMAKLTNTGAMLGTPAFMAPEQARGAEDVDARADIYAVGATMYQALSGKMPHDAASIPALLFAIVEKVPVPLRELRPDLPADLVSVVERAMAKNREERFPDAASMRAALTPWSGLSATLVPQPVSVMAATIASDHPPAMQSGQPATPIVVHRTPPPTPIVPYTPPPAPAPRKGRTATIIAVAVIAAVALPSIIRAIREPQPQHRRHEADDSDDDELGRSAARAATSIGLGAAAKALGVAVPVGTPAPSAVASALPSASVATTASAAPVHLHSYGGSEGYFGSTDFSDCKSCDWDMYRNDMGMRVPQISACFKASLHDPPIHQSPYYKVTVTASGEYVSFEVQGDQVLPERLNQCLISVFKSVPLHKPTGGAGSFKGGFHSECAKWGPPDKLKWCYE